MLNKILVVLLFPALVHAAQLSQQQFDEISRVSSRTQLDAFLEQHQLQLEDIINVENAADSDHTLVSYVLRDAQNFNPYHQGDADRLRLFAYLTTRRADLTKRPVQRNLSRYFAVVSHAADPVQCAERIIALEANLQHQRASQLEHWRMNQGQGLLDLGHFARHPQGQVDATIELAGEQKEEGWISTCKNIALATSLIAAVYFFVTREPKKDKPESGAQKKQ
jgi:hypothetical protein